MKKYKIEELIFKMNNIHNNRYIYNFENYKNVKSKILIKCDIHGYFYQRVFDHLNGCGCKKCGIIKYTNKKKYKLNELIEKSKLIHNNKYDYSLIDNHINMHNNINIICIKHGIFKSTFHSHINKKRGCKFCQIDKRKDNNNSFIKKSKIVHGNKYDYSLIKYKNSKDKVDIICPIHGIFKQSPNYHILGQGCPKCKISKGELFILNYLNKKDIKYIFQKNFKGLKYKRKLFFDFYLPEYNICIEFDGPQHFEIIKGWGDKKGLEERKIKDNIKNSYCLNNDITLLRIKYNENILEKINKLL